MAKLPPNRQSPWIRHAGIGIRYVSAVAGFGLVGWWIDSKWDSGPWGVLIGVALGLVGATYNLVRETMAAFAPPRSDSNEDDRDEGGDTERPE